MGLLFLQNHPDLLLDRFDLLQHLVIPESQHAKSGGLQQLRASLVIFCMFAMMTPIDLDNHLVIQTDKIKDKIAKRMLSAEFASRDLASTQNLPQRFFRVGHAVAKLALQLSRLDIFIGLADQCLPIPLLTSPLKGEEKIDVHRTATYPSSAPITHWLASMAATCRQPATAIPCCRHVSSPP